MPSPISLRRKLFFFFAGTTGFGAGATGFGAGVTVFATAFLATTSTGFVVLVFFSVVINRILVY